MEKTTYNGSSRKMPSKKSIYLYWKRELELPDEGDSVCWGCGFSNKHLDRCHLKPKRLGGADDVSNLVLLCRPCHHFQEFHCQINGALSFIKAISGEYPYFKAKIEYGKALL